MFLLLCNITWNNELVNYVAHTAHPLVLGGQLNSLHLLHNALHSNGWVAWHTTASRWNWHKMWHQTALRLWHRHCLWCHTMMLHARLTWWRCERMMATTCSSHINRHSLNTKVCCHLWYHRLKCCHGCRCGCCSAADLTENICRGVLHNWTDGGQRWHTVCVTCVTADGRHSKRLLRQSEWWWSNIEGGIIPCRARNMLCALTNSIRFSIVPLL
jgi:hypothetical protein